MKKTYLYTVFTLSLLSLNLYKKRSIKRKQKIFVIISVDWEGDDLNDKNLQSIVDFNKENPNIPLQHFICPAYFTKQIDNAYNKINKCIKENDNVGLHIHPWRSLVESSKIKYRNESSFYNINEDCDECGHTVPLNIYDNEEIDKLIKTSKNILIKNDLLTQDSFRAGGWLADKKVLEELIKNNFKYDCSAVNWKKIKEFGKNYENFSKKLKKIWNNIDYTTQPYSIKINNKEIYEFPNNGVAADWMSLNEMIKVIKLNLKKHHDKDNIFLSFMFHQENAYNYINRIKYITSYLDQLNNTDNYQIIFSSDPKEFLDL